MRAITLDYSTEDAASYNWMDEHKFNAIKEWCERNLQKSTKFCKKYDSIVFKHWCEETIPDYYEAKKSKYNCHYVSAVQMDEMLDKLGYEGVNRTVSDGHGHFVVYTEWKVKPTEELQEWLIENRKHKW